MTAPRPWKGDVERWAEVDGPYRYMLTRRWSDADLLWWCMLNPSRADDQRDDPTADKCCHYAHAGGHGGIGIVNLFAYVSTDPKLLGSPDIDPVGPKNDHHLLALFDRLSEQRRPLVLAWGASLPKRSYRPAWVAGRAAAFGLDLRALLVTKQGHPGHPLYLGGTLTPKPYTPAVYAR